MMETTTTRTNALIDPALHIWHVEIPLYLFLGGLVAGVMALTGYWLWKYPAEESRSPTLSRMPWSAPLLLSLGMLFLWLDLENRWNVFRFYLAFRPGSPMSWGSWILLAIYPISVLTAWFALPARDRIRITHALHRIPGFSRALELHADPHTLRKLAIASIIGGIALGIYTGVLLGTMAARPLWNSAVLGPLFLVSGLSTGAAFLLLTRLSPCERIAFARIDMALIAAELLLIALWLIGLASGESASRAAAGLLLGGPYTAAFWTLVITVGLLVPFIAEWIEHRQHEVPGRNAAVLVLIGAFALRWIIVYAGQSAGIAATIAAQ